MTLQELIEKLIKIKEQEGNLNVIHISRGGCYDSVDFAEVGKPLSSSEFSVILY